MNKWKIEIKQVYRLETYRERVCVILQHPFLKRSQGVQALAQVGCEGETPRPKHCPGEHKWQLRTQHIRGVVGVLSDSLQCSAECQQWAFQGSHIFEAYPSKGLGFNQSRAPQEFGLSLGGTKGTALEIHRCVNQEKQTGRLKDHFRIEAGTRGGKQIHT